MRFRVTAECWSRGGKQSSWPGKIIEAADVTEAIDQADRILARVHHRYKIKAEELQDG